MLRAQLPMPFDDLSLCVVTKVQDTREAMELLDVLLSLKPRKMGYPIRHCADERHLKSLLIPPLRKFTECLAKVPVDEAWKEK